MTFQEAIFYCVCVICGTILIHLMVEYFENLRREFLNKKYEELKKENERLKNLLRVEGNKQ